MEQDEILELIWDELPSMLDQLEDLKAQKHIWEETRKMNKDISTDLLRTRKALEECQDQRDAWAADFLDCTSAIKQLERENEEIDKILEGEG